MNPARLLVPAIRWPAGRAGDGLESVWPRVRRAIDLGVGGFVVFGGAVGAMRELYARGRERAGRPLLFGSDLERGAGQQLEGATPFAPAAALARLDPGAVEQAARITAAEALSAGIPWLLAPVADLDVEPANPIVGTRSFGGDPAAVAERVSAWVTAAQATGALACAKHFPGHGRTTVDSHVELPRVDASRAALEADLAPFRAAIDTGVRSIMMAHVVYPALDPTGAPASLSSAIVATLRDELGFEGLIATDALIMSAVAGDDAAAGDPSVRAAAAGCDLLLYPNSTEAAVAALGSALAVGDLDRRRIADSIERVEAAAADAAPAVEASGADDRSGEASGISRELAVRSIRILRGTVSPLAEGDAVRVDLIDDDAGVSGPPELEGPGAARAGDRRLVEALRRRGFAVSTVSDEGREPGSDRPGHRVLAVVSDVRGWKGRAGLAHATVERVRAALETTPDSTVVLFGHPRLADALPADATVLCAWSGEPPMQDAAAEWLVAGPRGPRS